MKSIAWILGVHVSLTFDLIHDLDLRCFKVKFRNSFISGIVGLIDVKWKGSELIGYWVDCMGRPIDMEQKGCESSIYDYDID